MIKINNLKTIIVSIFGVAGGCIASLLGGWDTALQTLIIFMAVDYVTGTMVAGFFKNSRKSDSGALQSAAGWKGLCRKGMTLLIVLVAAQLEVMTGTGFIRDTVIIGYVANESISIVENAGMMGLPIPEVIKKGIDILTSKSESRGIE